MLSNKIKQKKIFGKIRIVVKTCMVSFQWTLNAATQSL